MPGFDRTGPEGQGPRTGRQMGKCAPRKGNNEDQAEYNDRQGYGRRFAGRGLGLGRRWRRGFGHGKGFGRRRSDS